MDMQQGHEMQHGHGHEAWIYIMEMQQGHAVLT
jgi:hypothetical protein